MLENYSSPLILLRTTNLSRAQQQWLNKFSPIKCPLSTQDGHVLPQLNSMSTPPSAER